VADILEHFAAVRAPHGREQCACCEGDGAHGGRSCARCEGTGFVRQGSTDPFCPDSSEDEKPPRRRRHWREASIRRVGPEEYSKYYYPDYPAKTLPALARYFRKHEPDYYAAVHAHIAVHGVQEAMLVRIKDPRGKDLKRPYVMSGHHRAAAAFEQGQDMPVGDYDDQEDYDNSGHDFAQEWWQQHHQLKERYTDPRRHEAAGPEEYGIGHRPMETGAPAHDLHEGYSEDIYTHPEYWAAHNPPERDDLEGLAQLRRVRGKPDAPVHIYRATSKDAPHEINTGDWVTLSKTYAHKHAYNEAGSDDPEAQYAVHHAMVPARHVRDAGTDQYREQGYWGPPIRCCGKTAVLHGPDELPPDPGTAPIPEGHVRLWHYTRAANVPSIREHGLLRSYARGDSGTGDLSEPSAGVWASTKRPDDILDDHTSGNAAVVEYHAHPDEISGNAESPWQAQRKGGGGYDPGKLKDWASGYHHVIMRGDVHPHQILAIHEGWHGAARYMKHDDPSLESYQWIHDESKEPWNDHLKPYRRGLEALERQRRQGSLRAEATQPYSMQHEGPDPGEGEGLHEIGSGKIYPEDFHQRWWEYAQGADGESVDKVLGSKDWPSRKVWAYRALPSPHREVNTGDWVSTSKKYARQEGRWNSNPDDDYPVVKFQARAEHLRNEGNSLDEWSYTGPKVTRALVHFSGGKNHRGKGGRGKTDAMCYQHEPPEMFGKYEQANRERREKRKAERAAREAGKGHFGAAVPEIGFQEDYHGRHRVWAAGEGGLAASASGYGQSAGELHWHPQEGTITYLNVPEEHRRQGIATALYHRAQAEAQARGLVPPAHSSSRSPDGGDAWAHAVGGYLPPLEAARRLSGDTDFIDKDHFGTAGPMTPYSHLKVHTGGARGPSVPAAERTENVAHMLAHYQPTDFGTWAEVDHNFNWDVPENSEFVEDVRRNGVRRPIPVDYESDPPRVMNGHRRLLAAHRAGVETVPTRQHEGFMDPDDPDAYGKGPDDPDHWTNKPEWNQHEGMGQRGDLPRLEYYHVRQGREKGGYHAVAAAHEGQIIGHLTWGPGNTKIQQLWVHPQYRRHGVADALYQRSQWVEPGLRHHTDRTEAGNAWATAAGGELPEHLHDTTSQDAERRGAWAARQFQQRLDTGHPTMQRLAALPMPGLRNPHTGGSEWYHGSRAHPEELSEHGFADPMEMDEGAYSQPESETEGTHWNALMGTHFTADHDIAKEFALGEHSSGANQRGGDDPWRGESRIVLHARLGLRNPKVYDSEHDMDHEAYEREWKAGNHPSTHIPVGSDDEDERYEMEDMWNTADRLHRQYRNRKIPRSAMEGSFSGESVPHPTRMLWINSHPDKWGIANRFREHLKAQGHDGIIYGNEFEHSKHGGQANKSAIVFDPARIHVTQHHGAYEDCMTPEEGEHQQARLPGHGQQELPFGREHTAALVIEAATLGPLYHSTPYGQGFPYDEWMHVGTRSAAMDRARKINMKDYDLPEDTPTHLHTVRLHGRVYPHTLTDEQASNLTGSGYPVRDVDEGLPSGEGYKIFPYTNTGEDEGSTSYLAHRSAIEHVRHEVIPRPHTAAWQPTERIFGPTYGLDHRLFGQGEHLRPAVRDAIMSRLGAVLGNVLGPDWHAMATAWLAGSQASKWTGPDLEGNGDLDVLVGLSHSHIRLANPGLAAMTDEDIERRLNTVLRERFSQAGWHPPFDPDGKPYDLTGYAIHAADIRQINPYAAYNLSDDSWTVEPPDLPGWSAEQFPQGPALMQQARALIAEVRAILRLPEPFRSQEARRIWDYIHAGRAQAFTPGGAGWQGTGNVLEKALDQASGNLVGKLKQVMFGPPDGHPSALGQGMTTADLAGAHA
jgi:ribosomal protein S18 acetylase RimI-like enzyme